MLIVAVAIRNMEERVKVCDDAFREQLEAKEAAHHAHFSRLAVQKQKEVDLANEKVHSKIFCCC